MNRPLVALTRLLVVASIALVAAPAEAGPDDLSVEARAVADSAADAFRTEQFVAAARRFREAYTIDPQPWLLYNAGVALEQAEHIPEAIDAYEAFVTSAGRREAGLSDAKRALRELRSALKRRFRRVRLVSEPPGADVTSLQERFPRPLGPTPRVAWLPVGDVTLRFDFAGHEPLTVEATVGDGDAQTVEAPLQPAAGIITLTGVPEGATVRVGDEVVEGDRVEVSAGAHRVRVEADGMVPFRAEVEVGAGATVDVVVRIEAIPIKPVVGPGVEPRPLAPSASSEEAAFEVPVATWVLAGAAVASAGAAIGLGVVAVEGESDTREYGAKPGADPLIWDRMRDDADGLALGANIAWGIAGAAAIGSVVLLFVLQPDELGSGEEAPLTLAPWWAPEQAGGGVSFVRTF